MLPLRCYSILAIVIEINCQAAQLQIESAIKLLDPPAMHAHCTLQHFGQGGSLSQLEGESNGAVVAQTAGFLIAL